MPPKVLVAAPIHITKNYCVRDWISYTNSLTYTNKEILLVDNSPSKNYSVLLNKLMGNCKWKKTNNTTSHITISDCQNIIRQYAIKNNFDYILSLEVDIVPEINDLIERLLMHNKPIVGYTYYIMNGEKSHLMLQQFEGYNNYKSLVNLNSGADFLFMDGSLKRIGSIGLGCNLIHKSVFSKIEFRYEIGQPHHSDTYFAIDCYKNGIPIYVDTSMLCRHNNSDWKKVDSKKIFA